MLFRAVVSERKTLRSLGPLTPPRTREKRMTSLFVVIFEQIRHKTSTQQRSVGTAAPQALARIL